MNSQQIGRCGELLVQYKLLLKGIESSQMTTDSGIDLVAFSPALEKAVTIQVKTKKEPTPGGGKGKLALDWWIQVDCPAEYAAFVDLSTSSAWLFTKEEVAKYSQQESNGKYHFYFYVDPDVSIKEGKLARHSDFASFLLEQKVPELFFPVK